MPTETKESTKADVKITAFIDIFETKLNKLIKQIDHEKKAGNGFDKDAVKKLEKEATKLKKIVRKMKEDDAAVPDQDMRIVCPHCGNEV